MSKHLERDLENLEREVLTQSSVVEEMISKACRALREARPDLAVEVVAQDRRVDETEVQIEEACLKILALHQPVAVNLRRVTAILKINNDLERIADLAGNIAERAQSLAGHPEFKIPLTLDRMSHEAIEMVRAALDAFVELDVDSARAICARDNHVDALNREVIREVYDIMRSSPDLIEPALHFFSAARHVERIADHATNIAEDVIYLVLGEIARHKHEELLAS
jgi:phosphate transport system protein